MNQEEKRWLERKILTLLDDLLEVASDIILASPGEKERLEARGRDLVRQLAEKTRDLLEGHEEFLLETMRQMISQKLPSGPVLETFGPVKEELDRMLESGVEKEAPGDQEDAPGMVNAAAEEIVFIPSFDHQHEYVITSDPSPAEVSEGALPSWEEEEGLPEPYFPEESHSSRWVGQPMGEATLFRRMDSFVPSFPQQDSKNSQDTGNTYAPQEEPPFERILSFLFPESPFQRDFFFHGFTFDYYIAGLKLAIRIGEEEAHPRMEYLCRRSGITLVAIGEADLHSHQRVKRTLQRKGFSLAKNLVQ